MTSWALTVFYRVKKGYEPGAEPFNLAQQSGSFEVTRSSDHSRNLVLTQMVTSSPVDTCFYKFTRPLLLIGDVEWRNVRTKVSVYIKKDDKLMASKKTDWKTFSDDKSHVLRFGQNNARKDAEKRKQPQTHSHGVFIASQVESGGCDVVLSDGIHFYVDLLNKQAILSMNHNMTKQLNSTSLPQDLYNKWFTILLDVMNETVVAMIDNDVIFHHHLPHCPSATGFVTFGPINFGLISFDDFVISRVQY
ncbi:hypothetical protein HELRODRAFT_177504 [Helobdella robusta]|uniref:Glycosyl hydrolase family 59 C-terminal lectin domain-containing protein n=1 Tax=Helobdella robusta TaxID=6412 RepID=T1FBT6_HELRO|nr:hypothetical protein HELRODRAFT_177504 [Helobdella robusta]ESN97868.1 hypothetical protein HELRODRAFT_177504 [Helobdella robusta]